ncbi:MAG: four helix bundle protein [Blastocatellia bacterium]
MAFQSYQDLQVWQLGITLVERVYHLTEAFPQKETYALCNQMQRAAVSIPSNIAEGHARDSTKEFLHHLSVALGSLAELETQVIVAKRLGYVKQSAADLALEKAAELGRMLRGLQKSLKAKL